MPPEATATRRYPWPRFWTAPGKSVDDGFFRDHTASLFARGANAPQLTELVDEPCLVLLGEPGLGKSHAIADAVAELPHAGHAVHVVDLGAYEESASLVGAIVDSPAWREWRGSEAVLHLFLDGLDEALMHTKAVHKRLVVELKTLGDDISRLRLRISCRSAEWLPDFEAALAEIFEGVGAPRRLALAPLRAVDVAEAARAEGIDANQFLAEIFDRGLERLAAFPLTLRMMIDEAISGEGALPATQAELFDRAILRLAEEHDVARRRELAGAALHVGQRVVVAERIAAAMLLAGKAAVQLDLTAGSGADLTIRELAGFAEQDPDAAGGASFTVGVEQIQEVLATALFADLSGGRLTLAHRSLAEYLAARYLVHHDMDVEQVMSLLAVADDPDGRLIPQLREVAAWTATLDDDVLAELMDREPEILLRADTLTFTDEARARLVESLLTEDTAIRIDRYDRRVRRAFASLAHPGFPAQIRDALRPRHPVAVRQMAFTLAKAVAMPGLQPALVAFALDTAEPAFLRDDAVWALKDYADDETRAALVPLATERIENDIDDEIRGQALEAVFPSHLSVADVLRVLTRPRNDHMLGAYRVFVSRTFVEALRPEDLPEVLEWARTAPRDYEPTDLLSSLSDDVLALAWPHLDDDRVRAGVVAVIKPRLIAHHELLGPLHDSDDKQTFQEEHGRRLLVEDLIDAIAAEEVEPETLTFSRPALLHQEDYPWAITHLRDAIGTPDESAWAALAAWLFSPETCDIDEQFELAEQSIAFSERTAHLRDPVNLDSRIAQLWRRRSERERERQPRRDAPNMERIVLDHLDAIDQGNFDAWPQLNVALIYDKPPGRQLEADLTRLDGWARADDDARARMVEAAHRYVVEQAPPDPDDWLETNTIDPPAFAGYRALHLLAIHRPAQLEALDAETWTRWMPIVVGYPRSSGIDDERHDDTIVALAADRAPDALTHWVLRVVDLQNAKGDGHLFVLSRLRDVSLPELVQALGRKLSEPALKSAARGDLAEYGMRVAPQSFLPFAAEQLTAEAISQDRDAAVAIASAALGHAPRAAWPLIAELFAADREIGREVFEAVAYGERVDLAGELDDSSLQGLLDWLFESFPPAEDPPLRAGAGFVSRREQVTHVRDRLLAALAQRGSDAAVESVDSLAARFPSHAMARWKVQAREARLARWTAPEPRHVILLAQSNDARIVLSDAHLQAALMASLRRIEKRLQESSPPAARELWNTRGKPTPKYEEELSTWLKSRLEEDLGVGGRIIGRELEIRPNRTGRGRGQSVDLAVFAPIGREVEGAEVASVTIEVKGCWHAEVNTAMKSQLVDRYLTGTATTHGIYVVFWFAAEAWDPADSRRRRCTSDPQKMHDTLAEQARTLSTDTHATVRSFVLDGSLPPTRGPARRFRRLARRILGPETEQ